MGQNTMIIRDEDDDIYMTGLRLNYTPKKLNFEGRIDTSTIRMMACGVKHYLILTEEGQLLTWGSVFKGSTDDNQEGFDFHHADSLFDEGQVQSLEAKYSIFGALVEH